MRPVIITPPASQTISEDQTAVFSIAAYGDEPLSYQWQRFDKKSRNWSNLRGEDQPEYVAPIHLHETDDEPNFRCVVSNRSGSVVSSQAVLTMIRSLTVSEPDDTVKSTPLKPPGSHALVIGTFNAYFLPTFFSEKADPDDDEKRAKRLAKRILAVGYDIIALNEVFDEDARGVLVNLLSPDYPHYVSKLIGLISPHEDSGLMLFSKHPFEPLPKNKYQAGRRGKGSSKEVAFKVFVHNYGKDYHADKGAGYVRILIPDTGRVINVVFTHLQANYDHYSQAELDKVRKVRYEQLFEIKHLIEGSMLLEQIQKEDIFILGDLNIDGDLGKYSVTGSIAGGGIPEWHECFSLGGGNWFFNTTVRDCWAYETSPADRGITHRVDNARFDYIMRSRYQQDPEYLCLQHLILAYNLRDLCDPSKGFYHESGLGMAGWCDLSDHIGVTAVLNLWAAHSSPLTAEPLFGSGTFQGKITYPGSMQWLVFEEPGTYGFAASGCSGVSYHVYQSTDLTTPLLPYDKNSVYVDDCALTRYVVPEAPFYVRLFHPSPAATGTLQFTFKKFTGDSKDTACVLKPNEPIDHEMPIMPLNADDQVWFELDVDKVDSGKPQDLYFFLEAAPGTPEVFSLIIYDSDGLTKLQQTNNQTRLDMKMHFGPKKFYLVARRNAASHPTPATSFRIGWETNLTVLHGYVPGLPGSLPLTLTCDSQTDWFGNDTIFLFGCWADGKRLISELPLGDFDTGEIKSLDGALGVIRFVEKVEIMLRERDPHEDDYIFFTILRLDREKLFISSSQSAIDDGGGVDNGQYTFRYQLSRSIPIAK